MSNEAPPSTMPKLTFVTGAVLVLVGVVGYVASMINDTQHFTALIPSMIGVLLLVGGFISLKNLMVGIHIALLIAVIGALGMFMPLMNLGDLFAGEADNPGAVIAALISLLVLVVYLIMGIRSFLAARRWKKS